MKNFGFLVDFGLPPTIIEADLRDGLGLKAHKMPLTKIPNNSSHIIRRFLWAVVVFSCLAIAVTGCKGKSRKKNPQPGDKIYPVAVFKVPLEEISQSLEVKGTFVPSDKLDVKSETEGKIASVAVTEGQTVNVGDPLATVNPEVLTLLLEKQRADLREAESHVEENLPVRAMGAMRNFAALRRPRGLETGVPPTGVPPMGVPPTGPAVEAPAPTEEGGEAPEAPPSLEEAGEETPEPAPPPTTAELPPLEKPEPVRQAEDVTLDRLRAEIALTEKKIEAANLTAGIAGTIAKKNVAEGSVVTPGEILFQIVRLDPIWISVFVPPETAAALKPEEKPDVLPDDLPDMVLSGDIVFVSPEPDPQNKAYEIRVAVPNTQLKLKGGMGGRVLLPVTELRKVVTVPEEAVISKGGNRYVYVVEDQVAEKREVSLGKKLVGKFEVKRGLKEGDAVVTRGQQDLKEDQEFVKVESL